MNENYYFPQQQLYQPMYRQVPTPPPATGNGLIWVTGIEGAKSYLVAPNNTVMLMDSEAQRFYVKSADQSGMPLKIRAFSYQELSDSCTEPVQTDKFITREEFEQRLAALTTGGADNA